MKNYFYRSLAHLKHNPNIHISEQTPNKLNQLLDQKLHYINRSFKHNLQIQQIFLDIIKTKKTLHSKQIKQYYQLFTENKADSEIFHNTLLDSQPENIENYLHIPDARRSLKRLYCRLIQKLMIKLSYYMTNKQKLSFMYNEVKQMMKKCETLMRRLNCMRDLNSINELIQEIYRQNEDMQIKIIQELIDKGFIISIDEFYRINGVDLVDKQLYERVYSDLGYDEEEEPKEQEIIQKLKSIKKFEFNINNKSSFQRMIKEEVDNKKKDKKKPVHRTGYIEIQNKYRDLLVHLQNLINNDLIDEIAEEKESIQSSNSEIGEIGEKQSILASASAEIQPQTNIQTGKQEKKLENTQLFKKQQQVNVNSSTDQKFELNQQRPFQPKQYTKISSIQSNSKESSYCKSEFRQKDINLSNLQSNSHVSDILNNRGPRPNSLKKHTEYFSKSFMSAIKTMQKVNLNDKTNRLAIKRMSEHIFSIHKQSEQSSNADSNHTGNRVNPGNVMRRNNEKKSIINLINIYQSRKLQEEIHSMQKQFDGYRDKIIKKDETLIASSQKQNKLSLFYKDKKQLNQINHPKTITNITNYPKILDNRESFKDVSSLKIRKYQMNSILKLIPKLKMQQQLQEEFMKNIETIKAKIKQTTSYRIPYFQKASLNQRIQNYQYQLHSSTSSPGKTRKNKMQPNSILTTKGIETIDQNQFKSLICDHTDKINMCKTAFISPTNELSEKMVRFEIYDRKRRLILR